MDAISFETEEKIMTALAKELAKHEQEDWSRLENWQRNIYKKAARPFFNAMYNILREHGQ
jgi:hypothetical protein